MVNGVNFRIQNVVAHQLRCLGKLGKRLIVAPGTDQLPSWPLESSILPDGAGHGVLVASTWMPHCVGEHRVRRLHENARIMAAESLQGLMKKVRRCSSQSSIGDARANRSKASCRAPHAPERTGCEDAADEGLFVQ
jgi:hypothetical protein